jgi:hypothetical protein
MILIAHRGNTVGKFESYENEPTYIDKALSEGYDVEIDVWYKDGMLWLGHDKPEYGGGSYSWYKDNRTKLWVHCKNVEAINFFASCPHKFNYFWHENDTLTLTSLNYIWAYPGKQPIKNSISVLPELYNDDVSQCLGICSDYISKYK